VAQLREEAHRLASKLNGFQPGILADDDSPGCVFERETRGAGGAVPLWGQSGSFQIDCAGMLVRIEMMGLFGIGTCFLSCLGFSAHAVEWDRPFLSETGYRSFMDTTDEVPPGYAPDRFVSAYIAEYVRRELKGKLLPIKPEYRVLAKSRPESESLSVTRRRRS
jgi:hypothetical protein